MSNNEFIPYEEQLWNTLHSKSSNILKTDTIPKDAANLQPLHILATDHTPGIDLQAELGILSIYGNCCPQNALAFFGPILFWIRTYCLNPQPRTKLNINLVQVNDRASVYLLRIVKLLESLQNHGHQVELYWNHRPTDHKMASHIAAFKKRVNVPVRVTHE